jgi:hypothetical protein
MIDEEIARLKNRERQRQVRARDTGKAAQRQHDEETRQGRSILLERGVTGRRPASADKRCVTTSSSYVPGRERD